VRITIVRLRQIIQEELEAAIYEQSGGLIDTLISRRVPWMCRSGQTECLKADWPDEAIESEPNLACSAVLNNVWSYLIGSKFPMGLSDQEKLAMESPKVKKLLKNLNRSAANARRGKLSSSKMEVLLDYWAADDKTADSFRKTTTFGEDFLNVGMDAPPLPGDDADL